MSYQNPGKPRYTFPPTSRHYLIEDDGEDFQLLMFEGENQVAGALIPDDGTGRPHGLALALGEAFLRADVSAC